MHQEPLSSDSENRLANQVEELLAACSCTLDLSLLMPIGCRLFVLIKTHIYCCLAYFDFLAGDLYEIYSTLEKNTQCHI
jgi:hypothetical protein